jgi:hypothetical protein
VDLKFGDVVLQGDVSLHFKNCNLAIYVVNFFEEYSHIIFIV